MNVAVRSSPNHKQLGIFAREPIPGRVKSRLVPPLDQNEACEVYTAFLSDIFARVAKLRGVRHTVFVAGATSQAKALAPEHFAIEQQVEGSLGDRMLVAFERMLTHAGMAAVIGSDSPDIPLAYIKRAFVKLKHRDVVLGPAVDGGYYLIALKQPHAAVFEQVTWGQATVMNETLDRIESAGLSVGLLPVWYDVDTFESLALLNNVVRATRLEGKRGLANVRAALAKLEHRFQTDTQPANRRRP